MPRGRKKKEEEVSTLERLEWRPRSEVVSKDGGERCVTEMQWRASLAVSEEEDDDKDFPMTVVGIHDWDNLKDRDGHSHFMVANARFDREDGEGLFVMSLVPSSGEPIPLSKATVLRLPDSTTPIPWRLKLDMRPTSDVADDGVWRVCHAFSKGPRGWVRIRGLDVCPMFCVRAIRNRKPNADVADVLRNPSCTSAVVEHAAIQPDRLEAVVNPARSMCAWFREAGQQQRRELVQIDVFLRAGELYDDGRVFSVSPGAAAPSEAEEDGGEDDDGASTTTDASSIIFARYCAPETTTTRSKSAKKKK